MIHEETHKVTAENGGTSCEEEGKCCACDQAIGSEHCEDCVTRTRTVVLRYSFDVVVEVCESWDSDLIEAQRNGSWCADNAVEELDLLKHGCWCSGFYAKYVREATEEDEEQFVLPSLMSNEPATPVVH